MLQTSSYKKEMDDKWHSQFNNTRSLNNLYYQYNALPHIDNIIQIGPLLKNTKGIPHVYHNDTINRIQLN